MLTSSLVRIAILDDYQHVALDSADWSPLKDRADITVFNDHVADTAQVIERLMPFDVVCVMRERTALTREIMGSLPNLKLIASTGLSNAAIDTDAAEQCGIKVTHTDYSPTPTIESTWSMILAIARNITTENRSLVSGGWQRTLGTELAGKTLGLLGLGRIGSAVGVIGRAFRMNVIAWSQNLTEETAQLNGVQRVDKDALFSTSDFLSVHVRLSERTRGLVGAAELASMKPTSRIINTSRAAIVDTRALLAALNGGRLAGAAIDVYDTEPLDPADPLRLQPNVLATPHIGYVTREMYKTFYGETVQNIVEWIDWRKPPDNA